MSGEPKHTIYVKNITTALMDRINALKDRYGCDTWREFLWTVTVKLEAINDE